jgi:hypothetical protein
MTFTDLDFIFDSLGFYLADQYWVSYGTSAEINAVSCTTSQEKSKVKAMIMNSHLGGAVTISLNRRYDYDPLGTLLERAQAIVCIDIDGRHNKDTQAVLDYLVFLFEHVKFLEYSPESNGYHVYLQFRVPVFDYQLKNLEKEFREHGFEIEAMASTSHVRFPFSKSYSVYGMYDREVPGRVRALDIASLFGLWRNSIQYCRHDPSFETFDFHEELKNTKRGKSKGSIVDMLKENPDFDFGAGERWATVKQIAYFSAKYSLTLEQFVDVAESHDKGARGKTDYPDLYRWYTDRVPASVKKSAKTDLTVLWERIETYATNTALPEPLANYLEAESRTTLLPFLAKTKNISPGGVFKNPEMIRKRYLERLKAMVLHLIRYDEARHFEWDNQASPTIILPMVFDMSEGVGLPLTQKYLTFMGTKLKNSYVKELKNYLEEIGVLVPVVLNSRGFTYAPGTCIHYKLVANFP